MMSEVMVSVTQPHSGVPKQQLLMTSVPRIGERLTLFNPNGSILMRGWVHSVDWSIIGALTCADIELEPNA